MRNDSKGAARDSPLLGVCLDGIINTICAFRLSERLAPPRHHLGTTSAAARNTFRQRSVRQSSGHARLAITATFAAKRLPSGARAQPASGQVDGRRGGGVYFVETAARAKFANDKTQMPHTSVKEPAA